MSEWWEKAYPGGPMVGPSLIRPLYPPDANKKGKSPSTDGGDIQAIKRGISRAGRWPWQHFDNAFSNGFSHGTGGNVINTGLAGFQRQMGIDPTGWMGEGTYNAIRSARIPAGLPHAGEPILDATAINLLDNFSYGWIGGEKVRDGALMLARSFVGYTESPAGTNCNMFGSWYGMNYEPWCAMFVTYCFEKNANGQSPSFVKGSRYSYCPYILSDARNQRNGLAVTKSPIPGDLVLYDWERNGEPDHIGIFANGNPQTWNAYEGNTSMNNQSNGGEVMYRTRTAAQAAVTFVRVAEP